MKRILSYITAMACLAAIAVSAQTRSVTVNTNGVLVYPTNFFTTNLVGTVSGSGTSGYVPKWTSASALGNSIMSESGQTLSLNGGASALQTTTGNITVGTGGGNGNVVFSPNGTGATYANSSGNTPLITARSGVNGAGLASAINVTTDGRTAGDGIGITINGRNSSSTEITYGRVASHIVSPTAGAESSTLSFATRNAGSVSTRWKILEAGTLEAETAQTVRTLTGNLTLATAGGNGNILMTPNGSGSFNLTASTTYPFRIDGSGTDAHIRLTRPSSNTADWSIGVSTNELRFYDNAAGAYRWKMTSAGAWESTGAQAIQTSTGNLTFNTLGGNGNFLFQPNGSGLIWFAKATSNTRFAESGWLLDSATSASAGPAHKNSPYGYLRANIWNGSASVQKWIGFQNQGISGQNSQYGMEIGSSDKTALLFVRGDDALVGVNTGSPTSTFHVNGSEASAYAAKTTNYTLTATDQTILASASGGSITMTLPTSVGIGGRRYTVKRTDASANTLTVATTSSQTIDGSTSVTIPAYGILQVISDNANWAILNSGNVAGASATPTTAPNPLTRRVNHMIPQGGGTVTINGLGDTMSQSAGTQSAVSPDSNVGTMVKWATAATSGARAYGGGNANYRAGRNLLFAALVRVADTNAVRIWVAFTDGAITGLCDNDDPSGYHLAGFRWSTAAGDTAWMACTKDGTTLGTTSTGITPSTTAPMRLEVEEDTANAKYYFRINGTLVATRTANLPGTTVNMYYGMTAEPTENVSKSIEFGQATIVSDK